MKFGYAKCPDCGLPVLVNQRREWYLWRGRHCGRDHDVSGTLVHQDRAAAKEDSLGLVARFHRKFLQPAPARWSPGGKHADLVELADLLETHARALLATSQTKAIEGRDGTVHLRAHLQLEETAELIRALGRDDPAEVLDALVDLRYVTDGTVVAKGLAEVHDEALERVHAANMRKTVPTEPGERVSKPEGWAAPELGDLV